MKSLISVYGKPAKVIAELKNIFKTDTAKEVIAQFEYIEKEFEKEGLIDMLNIDFSVVNTTKYYNGMVFKGFIESIPNRVLSGGQYGKLLKKLGKDGKAIGFAVYLDQLEDLEGGNI